MKQVEIKQIRSSSFSGLIQPLEKKRSSQPSIVPQSFINQTFDCKQSNQSTQMSDHSQLLQVLEQQVKINQQLEMDLQQKNQIICDLQLQLEERDDCGSILQQLNLYKEVVEQLEVRINEILEENHELKSNRDLYRKLKRYSDENALLRETNRQMEQEVIELRANIDQFRQSVLQLKTDFKYDYFQISQTDKSLYIQELENQIAYLEELMAVDQQKMKTLEEKLNLMYRENHRMREQLTRKK